MKHINKFPAFLNEGIKASEAYHDMDSIQTVIDGKRDLAFLAMGTHKLIDPRTTINAMNLAINSGLNLIPVQNRKDGVAFVIYKNDMKTAQELADFAASKGGYLNDETPEEAEMIGRLLDYTPTDIAEYMKKYQR
jgi:hypothetical protein